MSWLRRHLQPFAKPIEGKRFRSPFAIEFDPSTVSKSVRANLRKNIELLDDLEMKHVQQIYEAALGSVLAGRKLSVLYTALMKIEGMTQGRAAEIALSLNNKATQQINRERQASLGITHARWIYANAPCMGNPSHPTATEIQLDSAHRAANGKRYEINKGLFVDGKWTWPGVEEGCKCISRPIIPELGNQKS